MKQPDTDASHEDLNEPAGSGRDETEKERIETLVTVLDAPDKKQALEDVFWALLNSPEFIFNH